MANLIHNMDSWQAYWCRESLGMFLCLPFLPNQTGSLTKYLVLYSLVYHTIKSRGVRQDALCRYSPSFGIMRVVIDKFYLHTTPETILTVARLFSQGLDTWIHHQIIRDILLEWPSDSTASTVRMIHYLFGVWVVHAALNQYFRCSTASVMVQMWYSMTAQKEQPLANKIVDAFRHQDDKKERILTDEDTEAESVSSMETEDVDIDEDYIVRKLLQPGRVPSEMKGRQGSATDGVDTAVRIETVLVILGLFFILGFQRVPFRALAMNGIYTRQTSITSRDETLVANVCLAWLLGSLLHGIWALFLRGSNRRLQKRTESNTGRIFQRTVANILDLLVLIAAATYGLPESGVISWYLAVGVTMKSYIQASRIQRSPLFWKGMKLVEFIGKTILARSITNASNEADHAWLEFSISFAWVIWCVFTPTPTPCEIASQRCDSEDDSAADIVFLGHAAELIDCWALWLLPYSLKERWQKPLWAKPLWPLHYLVGWYGCIIRPWVFGDKGSFLCCDDVKYEGIRMQTWTASHFGRHFITHPLNVKQNIEAAARSAKDMGVKVLCLGALNKAESINAGGVGVVKSLGSTSQLSVIHGNHLTAAAVVETTVQCFGQKAKIFLTGASSKVGWAVAQALRDRHGYEVMCHTTDPERRKFFEHKGFPSASKLSDGTLFTQLWIVGKYDPNVSKLIPQNATAVVFSVPHPVVSRPDVRVVEAGTLHMDLSRLDRPRQFTNKLKGHEIFACHAAGLVAVHRLKRDGIKRVEEIGSVDPNTMDAWLVDAKELGLQVPRVLPFECRRSSFRGQLPIVIIGAGPSGLAVAACLKLRNIPAMILETQVDPTQFGSWEHHFTGLEITSQKKWCNLPGFSMFDNKEFPGENITADNYRRYLRLYAARFGLDVRRGMQVDSIEKSSDASSPWLVRCTSKDSSGVKAPELSAFAVVVATGKHRIPNRNIEDNLASKLSDAKIPFIHTTDLRDGQTWSQVMNAATNGRLAIIGFGNSAADVASAILHKCPATAKVHIAARTVPPVFPRRSSIFRLDTIGYYFVRWLPCWLEEMVIRLSWLVVPSSRSCNAAFPSHLKRWAKVQGRVPVVDKDGTVVSGFRSGRLVGHGPVLQVGPNALVFDDYAHLKNDKCVPVEMVILATGYQHDCLISRQDRLNGLYSCGFGSERLLPIPTMVEDAQQIAKEIASDYC